MLFLLSLAGCTKTSSSTSSTGSETATVAGAAFSSVACYEQSSGAYYVISAGSGTATIAMNIKSNNLTVGSYSFDNSLVNNFASYSTGASSKNAASGTLNITSITAGVNIIGTFSFTCTDGTAVTNGKFTAVF